MFSTYELLDEEFTPLVELHKIKRKISLPGRDLSSRAQILANMINMMVFQPQQFLTLAKNDFIYLGHPEKYEIKIFSPEGKLIKKITRDYEPIPVSKKDMKNVEKGECTVFDLFDQKGRYIANFKTTVPVEGLFFNNGKAYGIETEEEYKFVKRYNFKIQEYQDNKWVIINR